MNFKKRLLSILFLLTILFPSVVFAYSNKVILGGTSIGIKVNTKYVMVVGFYKVDGKFIGEDAGIKIGDYISKVNNQDITSINNMISVIDKLKESGNIKLTVLRNNEIKTFDLPLIKDLNGVYKTGLYVKDQINGIGTLTYIDPTTNIYGALGHEIADKNTYNKIEINNGNIYKSEITKINPSSQNEPGSKEAKLYYDEIFGTINKNTDKGIFGEFNDKLDINQTIEVASNEEVKTGKAKIYTVLNDFKIEEYEIKIIDIDKNNPTKNILFEITDKNLLSKTGGVVAGMSGSPIVQNNKIIGAVTHVIVNEPNKGYGIFITTMLEEGERKE